MRPLTEPTTFIPAFSDRCINCHTETDEPIFIRHHLGSFIVDKPVCPGCIEEVTDSRYMCRNVADMTNKLYHKHLKDLHDRISNITVKHN